jgi:hypothetical protein
MSTTPSRVSTQLTFLKEGSLHPDHVSPDSTSDAHRTIPIQVIEESAEPTSPRDSRVFSADHRNISFSSNIFGQISRSNLLFSLSTPVCRLQNTDEPPNAGDSNLLSLSR